MAEINRKIKPEIKPVDRIDLYEPEKITLDNGIPVYLINTGTQELIKVDFIFNAGKWYEEQLLLASFTNNMLKEGTKKYSSQEIAEKIDFYGAHFETSAGNDIATVSLYTLNKYLEEVMGVVEEAIKNPVFPEKELATFVQNKKQEFLINNEKVRHVARRMFNKQIFGAQHPYGKTAVVEDFDKITTEALADFHKKHYSSSGCKIIVSGKIPGNLFSVLNRYFGDGSAIRTETNNLNAKIPTEPESKKEHIKKENAVQSAIRIGRPLFNKTHPDFLKLKVVNAILGGYFGSRLMTNIREDKGYTYGIGSAIVSLHNTGYFFIASEVGSDVTDLAIKEVYNEIEKLQQEKVGDEELNLVRNYLLGSMLRNFDGPFYIADSFKSVLEYGLDNGYFQKYIDTVRSITPDEIRNLAQQYFDKKDLFELVVG